MTEALWTRRRFLEVTGVSLLGGLAACGSKQVGVSARTLRAMTSDVQTFRSRPDLSPPTLTVDLHTSGITPGQLFLSPNGAVGQPGPMMTDGHGNLVWFRPVTGKLADAFRVQQYRGAPVLTWWEGQFVNGHGQGEYVIMNSSYEEVARVRAGNGYQGDLHEFLLTSRDTALLTVYAPTGADLSSINGPTSGSILDSIVQEVDVATGHVLFEWHSHDHVGLDESHNTLSTSPVLPFDDFHINAIDVDMDGHLLVSARNTWTIYKIDRQTGRIIWRLGGKQSDFAMGAGSSFAWQHDARRLPDGTLSLFDDGSSPAVEQESRGIVLNLDEGTKAATLARAYSHPLRLLAGSQGNMQRLAGDHMLVGWGAQPYLSEFTRAGKVVFDARLPGTTQSYRAYRFPWTAQPVDRPAMTVARPVGRPFGPMTAYVSWNGATDVASWTVLAGSAPAVLAKIAGARRTGFETAIPVHTALPYLAAAARDGAGRLLGMSAAVPAPGTT